jgi:hypothetical protein
MFNSSRKLVPLCFIPRMLITQIFILQSMYGPPAPAPVHRSWFAIMKPAEGDPSYLLNRSEWTEPSPYCVHLQHIGRWISSSSIYVYLRLMNDGVMGSWAATCQISLLYLSKCTVHSCKCRLNITSVIYRKNDLATWPSQQVSTRLY